MSPSQNPLDMPVASAMVMGLLRDRVPITLLLDLYDSDGPGSQEILETEGLPDDAWWQPRSSLTA